MSKKRRALEKQKKQNSPEKKAKNAKKQYYQSAQARAKWDEKKSRKQQSRVNQRVGQGISSECPLNLWEEPSTQKCDGCTLKCTFKKKDAE